jgi:hypothetical protein
MSDLCEHNRPFRGCPDCDPPMTGLVGAFWAAVAMVILAGSFAIAWWWVA